MLGFNDPPVNWRLFNFTSLLILAAAASAAPVDYLQQVKPILAEHCYRCHGASQQKHELRLDTAASALKGGESGPAIKPRRSADSLLVRVIKNEHNSISRMPYKKPPLSDAQITVIARWIDEGAAAPVSETPQKNVHWAFVAPKRPEVPVISESVFSNQSSSPRPRARTAGTRA